MTCAAARFINAEAFNFNTTFRGILQRRMSGSESSSSPDPSRLEVDSSPGASIDHTGVWTQNLRRCLDSVESAGNSGHFDGYEEFANPGLQLEGNRTIPLPLTLADAEAIKAVCRRAPFGKGDQTLVDTNVRNTWELDPSQFHLANPAWKSCFANTLQNVANELALISVTARLHKLLLYEEGSSSSVTRTLRRNLGWWELFLSAFLRSTKEAKSSYPSGLRRKPLPLRHTLFGISQHYPGIPM